MARSEKQRKRKLPTSEKKRPRRREREVPVYRGGIDEITSGVRTTAGATGWLKRERLPETRTETKGSFAGRNGTIQ